MGAVQSGTGSASGLEGAAQRLTVRAQVGHALARMKNRKILRDCRLKGDGVYWATNCVAHMHNLTLSRA